MNERQDQGREVLKRLEEIWVGFSSNNNLVTFLARIADSYGIEMYELTDKLICTRLKNESQHISDMCNGSVLNG